MKCRRNQIDILVGDQNTIQLCSENNEMKSLVEEVTQDRELKQTDRSR